MDPKRLLSFNWVWFTMVMATGSITLLVHSFPYQSSSVAFKVLTLSLFFLNLLLFVILCAARIAGYWVSPEKWSTLLKRPDSLFIGAFPVGATTLINAALIANQDWKFGGVKFLYTLWAFWWLDAAVSYIFCFGIICAMITIQTHKIQNMTAVWLFPVVTIIVASSSGALLSEALAGHSLFMSIVTTAVSLTMVAIGISVAFMVITILLLRLVVHGPPESKSMMSTFIILNPLGQGGYCLLLSGQNITKLGILGPPEYSPAMGEIFQGICLALSYALWSLGMLWIVVAIVSIGHVVKEEGFDFSIAYWGVILPNASYAMLSLELASVLHSTFFRVSGAVYAVVVFLAWLALFVRTLFGIVNGSIFDSSNVPTVPGDPSSVVPRGVHDVEMSIPDGSSNTININVYTKAISAIQNQAEKAT